MNRFLRILLGAGARGAASNARTAIARGRRADVETDELLARLAHRDRRAG